MYLKQQIVRHSLSLAHQIMHSHIQGLPYELLSAVLQEAASLNIRDGVQYTYGLSQAPEPLQNVPIQRVVRGQVAPDAVRWNAVQSIRQVARLWHDWASEYALKNLQISRWRGSERYAPISEMVKFSYSSGFRWMQSRNLDKIHKDHSSIAVYRDPYHSLRKTAQLFERSPSLASCVRKIWFNGYYGAETMALIFSIIRLCNNLDHLTVPWTALRYGDAEDWSNLLGRNRNGQSISSLEFLAVDLKQSQMSNTANRIDRKPLYSSRINFSGLRRLKVFGNSNFMPLIDEDLIAIANTAANLRELHITGTSSVTIDGVAALIDSSDKTLEILEHSPLAGDGFERPIQRASRTYNDHLCHKLQQCPHLLDLSFSLPSLCKDLFTNPSVNWQGNMQIRTSTLCGRHPISLKTSENARKQFWSILDQARSLMLLRERGGAELNIEIFIDNWIFEPRRSLVHGNLQSGRTLSDETWPANKASSWKGPYGQTGLYGKDDGPYDSVDEEAFEQGIEKHYVSF